MHLDRLAYVKWIETIPKKRNKRKSFARDDDFFWAELQKGLLYEKLIARILQKAGVESVKISDDDNFRDDIKASKNYSKNAKDLIIKGHSFEVKSRSIPFQFPSDWPKRLSPIYIDTVSSVESKKFKVAGYIFISQKTGRLMGLPYNTKHVWTKKKMRDAKRGLVDEFYAASPSHFDAEEKLIESLINLQYAQ